MSVVCGEVSKLFVCLLFFFVFFFFKQKTAYEIHRWLEFRRVLFRSHYLSTLQERQRWHRPTTLEEGDIVLLKDDDTYRGDWRLCRIHELIISRDGLVRRVNLRIGDRSSDNTVRHSYLERPITKLIQLIPKAQQLWGLMFVHYSIHVFVFYVPCICIVVLSLQVKKKNFQTIKIVCLPSGFQL